MINKYLTIILLFICVSFLSYGQSSITGKVTEGNTGEPVLFGDVALYKEGVLVTGTQTDFDGNYIIANIDGGTYDIQASYVGFTTQQINDVIITQGKEVRLDIALDAGLNLDEIVITEYRVPLIEVDNTSSGGTLTAADIQNLPTKNINALASLTAGLSSQDGGAISARGSRSSGTTYFLDGIRVSGTLPAQSEIEQLTTLIGGIPASYGDVTGAVISLTSKGPSNKFSGGVEVETSEFLDEFGYNLLTANLSGPILKNKVDQSVIGFRVSGQYRNREDDGPTATGVYRTTEAYYNELIENPINELEVVNAEYDRLERNGGSLQLLEARPNQSAEDLNMTARLDFRIGGALDVSVSGNYIDSKNQFAPGIGGANNAGGSWQTYNWVRNPFALNTTYRGNVKIRHRLGGRPTLSADDDPATRSVSAIRNVSYTITGGYQHNESSNEDPIHQDRIFEYGYVGNFGVDYDAAIDLNLELDIPAGTGEYTGIHTGYNSVTSSYTPNNRGINPAWVALNRGDENTEITKDVTSFNAFNGSRNTRFRNAWSYHAMPGTVYNRISKSEADRYTIDVRTNFDFAPGGSEKGRHSIEIGFLYEQRESRSYTLSPERLYSEARIRVNQPLLSAGVDSNLANLIRYDTFAAPQIPGLTINDAIVGVYQPNLVGDSTNNLFGNVRAALGIGNREFVNIDAISPENMRLEWFEAEELTDNGLVDYFGYDYLGNRLGSDVTFDDFFADRDGDGRQDFVVGAFQPNYLSAFIQDKFSFKDIIFRLGVRMERYDANTRVLKDPFSLYEIMSAEEYSRTTGNAVPDGIDGDFKVYAQNADTEDFIAFRKEEQWYNAAGELVNDGSLIFGQGGSVQPYYKERDIEKRNVQTLGYNLDQSFEDYEPELNFAPRLSFSFPISEASNFFANYDVLYQRPNSGVLTTPLDFYYFEENAASNRTNSNPNLQPVQTTQYEIGFNQKISNSSALKIQAFYKEERDRVQARTLQQVASPIGSYATFDNIDFATVKGFSFTYDLRRTGNILVLANYTLQFADGTGSNTESQLTLASTGQTIRTLSALDFDERHKINITVDYRYKDGKRYNGPKLFGADIFANAGINIQAAAQSGQPYTKADLPSEFGGTGFSGGLNENRLPWTNTLNLRIDKDFTLFRREESKKALSFNVYFRVQNLFNTKNIVGVYTYTGDSENPGYLSHIRGQSLINGTKLGEEAGTGTVASLLDLYEARVLAPGFFTLPRRIYLGAYFNF